VSSYAGAEYAGAAPGYLVKHRRWHLCTLAPAAPASCTILVNAVSLKPTRSPPQSYAWVAHAQHMNLSCLRTSCPLDRYSALTSHADNRQSRTFTPHSGLGALRTEAINRTSAHDDCRT
jgi:hypothetical protein